jgi:hypothetical protein
MKRRRQVLNDPWRVQRYARCAPETARTIICGSSAPRQKGLMGSTRLSVAAVTGLLAVMIGGITSPALGQTSSVTLAWDPNPEPTVAGYVIYVGNESGRYQEQFDVGPVTSFAYMNPVPGRPYFFAVAAYESRESIGPRSEEVLYLSGVPATDVIPPGFAAASVDGLQTSAEDPLANDSRRAVCATTATCYSVDRVAALRGSANALELAQDGRLFFILDGASVQVIDREGLLPEPALRRDSAHVAFVDLVLDPDFSQNRLVYIAEVGRAADGRRELNIARYRELANVFAERAVIVAGLPMSPAGTAVMTVDSAHRLYVALPADASRQLDPYQGMVLRFAGDGSVPDRNRAGSPVFTRGYAEPVSIEWDKSRGQLWLTGASAGGTRTPVVRLPVDEGGSEPAARTVSTGNAAQDVVLIDAANGIVHITSQTDRVPVVGLISSTDLGGEPTSAAVRDGVMYLTLILDNQDSSPTSHVVRLRRD